MCMNKESSLSLVFTKFGKGGGFCLCVWEKVKMGASRVCLCLSVWVCVCVFTFCVIM